jgi:hypothetical protein
MIVDIYPFGESAITYEILRSISMMFNHITGDGGTVFSMVKLGALIGLLMVLVRAIVSQKIDFPNLMMAVVIWTALIVPTATVNVWNRQTGILEGIVEVPFAIALSAQVLGGVSHGITTLFRDNFSNTEPWPADNPVGALQMVMQMREKLRPGGLGNPELKNYSGQAYLNDNTAQYIENCVLYKYMVHSTPAEFFDSILTAPDTLASIASDNNGWHVTTITFPDGSKSPSVCSAQYSIIATITSSPDFLEDTYSAMARNVSGSDDISVKSDFLKASVNRVVYLASGSAQNNVDFMSTLYIHEHIKQALTSSSLIGDSGTNFFISKMVADARETRTVKTIADASLWSEVVWKYATIIECLTYALLPLILFFMFMGDFGIKIFWKHFAIMAWVALWSPISVVVESFISYSYDNALSSVTEAPGSILYQFEVYSAVGEWLAVGYNMYMMVPAIAFMIVGGGVYSAQQIISKMDFGDTVRTDGVAPTTGSVPFGSNAAVAGPEGSGISRNLLQDGTIPDFNTGASMAKGLDQRASAAKSVHQAAELGVQQNQGQVASSLESLGTTATKTDNNGVSYTMTTGSGETRSLTNVEAGVQSYGIGVSSNVMGAMSAISQTGANAPSQIQRFMTPNGQYAGKNVVDNFNGDLGAVLTGLEGEKEAVKHLSGLADSYGGYHKIPKDEVENTFKYYAPHIAEGKGSLLQSSWNGSFADGEWAKNKKFATALKSLKGAAGVAGAATFLAGSAVAAVTDLANVTPEVKLGASGQTTDLIGLSNSAGNIASKTNGRTQSKSTSAAQSETSNVFKQLAKSLSLSKGTRESADQAASQSQTFQNSSGAQLTTPGQAFYSGLKNLYDRDPAKALALGRKAYGNDAPQTLTGAGQWARNMYGLAMKDHMDSDGINQRFLGLREAAIGKPGFDMSAFTFGDSAETRKALTSYFGDGSSKDAGKPEKAVKNAENIGLKMSETVSPEEFTEQVTGRVTELFASDDPADKKQLTKFMAQMKEDSGIDLPYPDMPVDRTGIKELLAEANAESGGGLQVGKAAETALGTQQQELLETVSDPEKFKKLLPKLLSESTEKDEKTGQLIGPLFTSLMKEEISVGQYTPQQMAAFKALNSDTQINLDESMRAVAPQAMRLLELARGAPKEFVENLVNQTGIIKGLTQEGQTAIFNDAEKAAKLVAVGQYLQSPEGKAEYANKPEELAVLTSQYENAQAIIGGNDGGVMQIARGAPSDQQNFIHNQKDLATFNSIEEIRKLSNAELPSQLNDLMDGIGRLDGNHPLRQRVDEVQNRLEETTGSYLDDPLSVGTDALAQKVANDDPAVSAALGGARNKDGGLVGAVTQRATSEGGSALTSTFAERYFPGGFKAANFSLSEFPEQPASIITPASELPAPSAKSGIAKVYDIDSGKTTELYENDTKMDVGYLVQSDPGVLESFEAFSRVPYLSDVRVVTSAEERNLSGLGGDYEENGIVLMSGESKDGKNYYIIGTPNTSPSEAQVEQFKANNADEFQNQVGDSLRRIRPDLFHHSLFGGTSVIPQGEPPAGTPEGSGAPEVKQQPPAGTP